MNSDDQGGSAGITVQSEATEPNAEVGEAGGAKNGHNLPHRRSRAIGFLTALAFTVCALQLFSIQIVQGPALAEQGRKVRTSASEIAAPRGRIVDANGQVLVDSIETYHIAVNQKNILEWRHYDDNGNLVGSGPADAAKQLAPLLKMDPSVLGGMMLGDSTYVYLAKNVDAATYRQIRALGIYGIEWEPVYERVHPSDAIAASVVGSVNTEGQGDSGLELVYNDQLTGVPGEESYEIGPTGEVIPGAKSISKEVQPGSTIDTSLDVDLQTQVQNDLDGAVTQFGAQWGAVVVMEVGTSRVLVLADSGLGSPSNGPQPSRAVQMVFEPGSVGKVITIASALEAGKITPTTAFTIPESYTTSDGEEFTDLHEHETYQRTVAGILTESSNTGAVQIGELVSADQLRKTMTDLGLGQPTGIELPGESDGILSSTDQWVGRGRYTPMFGQGYAITAIQEAAMMAAIGNDGVWQAPRLVDGTTNAAGDFVPAPASEPRQALQPETAKMLLTMMESVADNKESGTGSSAAVDGYRIAIKTGTSELMESDGTVATVAGVIPADAPRLAIAVVLYDPKIGFLSSESAAPLFKKVATNAVRTLGIPASASAPELYPTQP